MSEQSPNVSPQPACAHLLSKGMFVTGQIDPAEVGHSDGYCWCNRTQNLYGPDDQLVDRTSCTAGRQCFEARV